MRSAVSSCCFRICRCSSRCSRASASVSRSARLNGALITFGRVPSLVATLSTLYIVRGADYAWVHGGQINATSLPDAFALIATGSLFGVPNLVLIALVVLVALAVYLKQYRGGREHYAIGSNPEAARLAGIRVERRVMIGFLLSGAIAGLAGRAVACALRHRRCQHGEGHRIAGGRGGGGRQRRDHGRRGHGDWARRSARSCSA